MYDFVDRRVTSLDQGGRFLIWSMRSWVRALHDARCPCTAIGPAFGKWRMIAGLPHFHMMMAVLNKEAIHNISFGPLGCLSIREHEAIIISLVRGLYVGPHEHVRDTIQLLVNEDSVATMMTAITAFGQALVNAGLFPGSPAHAIHVPDHDHE